MFANETRNELINNSILIIFSSIHYYIKENRIDI